jgi:hypothetical protein
MQNADANGHNRRAPLPKRQAGNDKHQGAQNHRNKRSAFHGQHPSLPAQTSIFILS